MNSVWHRPAGLLFGLVAAGLCAMPQSYTISARPGAINYVEGVVSINGGHVLDRAGGRTFLTANDILTTGAGKAEVLLTPGVFLRVGSNSEIKMISPTLTNTEVALLKGEAMIEAAELVKENNIQLVVNNATIRLEKIGLYQFRADDPATAAVIEGKLVVEVGDRKVDLGKNRELVLTADLKSEKFNSKDDQDELYAWSKSRDEYDSAASYAAAKNVSTTSYAGSGVGWGYGFSGFGGWGGPGWFWNPAFSSYAWLPGDGAFFSPFGFGFYAPGYIGYAPVAYTSVGGRSGVAVPVNPGRLPVLPGSHPGSHPAIYTASGQPYHANAFVRSAPASGGHISGNSFAAAHASSGNFGGSAHSSAAATGAAHASSGGGVGGGGHSGGGGHR